MLVKGASEAVAQQTRMKDFGAEVDKCAVIFMFIKIITTGGDNGNGVCMCTGEGRPRWRQ